MTALATTSRNASPLVPVLRSELIKLRTARSTYIAVGVAVIVGLGVGLGQVLSDVGRWATMNAADRAAVDPVGDSLSGFLYGELALGVLGVLAVSTEYSTGMIRATLTATPWRGRVYIAKTLTLAAPALLISELCAFSAFLLGQVVLHRQHANVSIGDGHALRAVACAGLFMTMVTLTGFGLGALLRHTGAAIGMLFALVFLGYSIGRSFESISYLPDHLVLTNVATTLGSLHQPTGPHAARYPSYGFALFALALYLIIFLGLGAWRALRDA